MPMVQTVKIDEDGHERYLNHFDAMHRWLNEFDALFATIPEDISPLSLPSVEFEQEGRKIFMRAVEDDEKSMIFGLLFDALVRAKREPCFIEGGKKTVGDLMAPIIARAEKSEAESKSLREALEKLLIEIQWSGFPNETAPSEAREQARVLLARAVEEAKDALTK